MEMIWHAAIRIHSDPEFRREVPQLLEEFSVMPIVVKNQGPLVATIDHMVAGIRVLDSKWAGHERNYTTGAKINKEKTLY